MTKLGNFDQMNPAVADFFADADDGKVWLFPESFNDEFFFYRKDIFAKYNLNAPTNWDEFLQVCDTLKKNGEIPVVIAGAEQWQIMRYLSFIPWRVTHV
jgi:raffinose/stachyose/melibiose transport system substrate-binding protein